MVIDGCPYKENQKERAWETGLSTTASQVSTIDGRVTALEEGGSGSQSSSIEFVGSPSFSHTFSSPVYFDVEKGYIYIFALVDCEGNGVSAGGGPVAAVYIGDIGMEQSSYADLKNIPFFTFAYNDMITGANAVVTIKYPFGDDRVEFDATGDDGSGGFSFKLNVYRIHLPTS